MYLNVSIYFRMPVFTEYFVRFDCTHCPARHKLPTWNAKQFDVCPILLLPTNSTRPIGVGQLLSTMLGTPQNVDCPTCGTTNAANWETKKGD